MATPELAPPAGTRDVPITDVAFTDAELDHVAGILQLREGTGLRVHATSPVLGVLSGSLRFLPVLSSYTNFALRVVGSEEPFTICGGAVAVNVIPLSGKRPRYAGAAAPAADWVVGYRFTAGGDGGLLYAPCFGDWSDGLDEAAREAGCIVIDGTFWSGHELADAACSTGSQESMGHLPISGADGSLERIRTLPARRIYTHVNNTNPVLDASSAERASVEGCGVELAWDGLEIEL